MQNLFSRFLSFLATRPAEDPLGEILRDLIRNQGPLGLDRYMQEVLHHPLHGYYSRGCPVGPAQDFVTAPEISPLFSERLAVWCVDIWALMGKPAAFTLLELGPGLGTMMRDILRITAAFPDFQAAMKLCLLESSETLRRIQIDKLAEYAPRHLADIQSLPEAPLIVLSNEFFDTIPLRQFIKRANDWLERCVIEQGNGFALTDQRTVLAEEVKTELDRLNAPDGFIYEMSPASRGIMRDLAAHIAKHGGAGVMIDYGYAHPSGKSTLRAVRRQKISDNFFDHPGSADVTADVDFSALGRAAEEQGLKVAPILSQATFLKALGIDDRLNQLEQIHAQKKMEQIRQGYRRLISPLDMGEPFKVIGFTNQSVPALLAG